MKPGNPTKFGLGQLPPPISVDGKKNVLFDINYYQSLLDCPELTDRDKEQMIEALWATMMSFVELGHGIHSLQEVKELQAKD